MTPAAPPGAAERPSVSVVMPVRDAAATLPACLRSIRRQSYTAWELIAVDDGSEDDSPAVLRRAAAEDPRIRVLRPGRVGLVAALNLGIGEARSDLVARMDADDLMHPERLRLQVAFLRDNADTALVASRVRLFPWHRIQAGYREYVRWQNHCLSPDDIAHNLYVESPFAHPSVTMRRAVLERLGGYCEGPFPEDYELWLRMHHAGCRMAKLPQTLLAWRESEGRASRVDPRYARDAFDRLRARFLAREPRLRTADEVVVWGAGRKTRRRVQWLFDEGIRPSAWVDIDPRKIGREVQGLRVHPPGWLHREPRPFVLAYVASHGARELIAERLDGWGYRIGRDYLAVG
jgi:glycosyltransferase involved in cell wall biosynthesis